MSGGCTPSVVKGEGNTNEYKYPNLVHTRVECFYFFGCLYLAGKLDLRLQGKELKGRMTGLGFFFAFFFCVLCRVQLFATPWTLAHQAPLSRSIYVAIWVLSDVLWF